MADMMAFIPQHLVSEAGALPGGAGLYKLQAIRVRAEKAYYIVRFQPAQFARH